MLFTKLTKRKLSLILTCSICLNLLAACEHKKGTLNQRIYRACMPKALT